MPLRSLTTVPPGGWRLEQVLPSGETKKWHSMGLVWEFAEQIADFRAGNGLPNAMAKEVVHEIEAQTCLRLHDDPAWCVKKKSSVVRAAIDRLSKSVAHAADGGRVLVEWLGDGAVPVPVEVSQARADVCVECPHNREGHSFFQWTADKVRAVAEQLGAKDRLKLRVRGEEGLHACAICACPLPLKVHVPLATILNHTDAATLSGFPSWCWLTTEQQTL